MFLLAVLVLTFATAGLPLLVSRLHRLRPPLLPAAAPNWLPVVAAGLFIGAFFVPDIGISPETTTFQQHFIGGGMYAACLYAYCCRLSGWRPVWWLALVGLFAWVSTLGVAVELVEFAATRLRLAVIGTGDTDWDLLANTLGALASYILLIITRIMTVHRRQ